MNLYADNDFGGTILLESIDETTLAATPITSGAVATFLARTKTAPLADAVIVGVATYIGDQVGQVAGTWGYFFDGGDLDGDTLDALSTTELYLIIQLADDVRVYVKLKYIRARPATLS
jgi:hypothetical protein